MEKNTRLNRVTAFMKAAGLAFQRIEYRVDTAYGQLFFEDKQVKIVRPGCIDRVMPYERLNVDRLVALATSRQ
jgi:hypothetical protein